MDDLEKRKIGQRLTARVSTGLNFVESDYLHNHTKPDPASIRNPYILLSFYSKLLLKTIVVATEDFKDKRELDIVLRKLGHNLEKIGTRLGTEKLNAFGIKGINTEGHEYLVETDDGNFRVMDFDDIRYDFVDGRVRTLRGSEHHMFSRQIFIMHKINGQLKKIVW